MTGISLILALAVGIEKFTELLKQFLAVVPGIPDKVKPVVIQLLTAAIGILVAIGANLDLFKEAGIQFNIPYVGMIALGLVLGRGANYAHDFFTNLKPTPLSMVESAVQLTQPVDKSVETVGNPIQVSAPVTVSVEDIKKSIMDDLMKYPRNGAVG